MPIREVFSEAFPAAVTTGTSLTDIVEIDASALKRISADIAVATEALDAFEIQVRVAGTGTYRTLKSTAAHFTAPSGVLLECSGDLTVLASGSNGQFLMDCAGYESVRIQASSAAGTGVVTAMFGKYAE